MIPKPFMDSDQTSQLHGERCCNQEVLPEIRKCANIKVRHRKAAVKAENYSVIISTLN